VAPTIYEPILAELEEGVDLRFREETRTI